MSLKAQLDSCRREYEASAEPHVVDAARRSIQALAETGLVAKAVKAGETAPLFRLRRGRGNTIDVSDLLNRGPAVVSFYLGDWCPFCVLESQALAAAHQEIERLGATLIALSPQTRGPSPSPGSHGEAPFPILQDPGGKVASRYRIDFAFPEQYRAAYLALGHPNPAKTGSKGWMLPIPATYVVNRADLVVLSYLDTDYTTRLETTEIIVALTHLRAANIPTRNNR
jgi:peroxiredoxin